MNKNQNGFGVIGGLLVVVVISFVGLAGWYVHSQQNSNDPSEATSSSERILSHTILRTDCAIVLPKLQKHKPIIISGGSGDVCYASPIQAGDEKIEYLILTQSSEFQKKVKKETDATCTLDCGGIIPINRQDFIVRANGKIETANHEWAGTVSIATKYLTGCPLGSLEKYENQGEFIIKDDRVGIHFAAKNINYSAEYDSACSVDIDAVNFTSADEPSLLFSSLAVRYNLADANVCSQQDDVVDQDQCYNEQAGMRGDLSICNKALELEQTRGTASDDCFRAVALRKLDESICQSDHQTSQCVDQVEEHKSYMSGMLVTTGL